MPGAECSSSAELSSAVPWQKTGWGRVEGLEPVCTTPYRFLKPPPGRRCVETGEASPFPGCVSAAFECFELVKMF
ncbi:hypothetical protein CEXT_528071 [Caerostris extrusa]|uniref:Uncharacterized protein n=1 Tax=Caerostris extrusa TaxID=172846 RepID=A0AAV4R8N4_CAEEX|nr:hypothetical protein CEXT_528071 [Caerostris extrusa]